MSDFANMLRGSKKPKETRANNVLKWFCDMVMKDKTIDTIRKGNLFDDYERVIAENKEGKATEKDIKRYSIDKALIDMKKGDLTDKKINEYTKKNKIPFKVKQHSINGWEVVRTEENQQTETKTDDSDK